MLRNKVWLAIPMIAVGLAARPAHAIENVCNTAYVDFTNSASTAMTAVVSSTCFTAQSNPVLSVVKTPDKWSGVLPGDTVTYTVTVSYPKLSLPAPDPGLCNDDSQAKNIVITDPLPAGVTYVPNSLKYGFNGAPLAAKTDAASDDELQYISGTKTVSTDLSIPALNEGDGDGACAGQTTRTIQIQYQVTKN